MALTLIEAAKNEKDPARNAVISELAMGEFLGRIPFRDIDSAGLFYEQEGDLPYVGFRGLNEGTPDSYGVLNPQSEALKIFSTDVDVDIANLDWHGEENRASQIRMKVKALRKTAEDKFFNGNSAANAREFDGLKRRIHADSSQAVDITVNGALSLFGLDELIDAVEAEEAEKILVMDKAMARRFSQASRDSAVGGHVNFTTDSFGRRVTTYNDIPIVRLDVNAANEKILPFNEGSGSDRTSIYCIAFGDQLTTAIQGKCRGVYGVSVRELGEVDDAPVDRTRMEWYAGLAILHGRSVARGYNIANTKIVA
jgi:hypothetical protein